MHSLMPPTPPYSPVANPIGHQGPDQDPLRTTMHVLDSLVASYHYRRMWVCRTRAAFEGGMPEYSSLPSSSDSQSANEDPSFDYREYDDVDAQDCGSPSRWSKRKRGFKLPRIDGLSPKRRRITTTMSLPGDSAESYAPPSPSREDILSMYERMMESRMESCERINKMLREASRASLHNR